MKLDDILNEVYETAYAHKEINDDLIKELRALNWGYENYYIAVWGKPDIDSISSTTLNTS